MNYNDSSSALTAQKKLPEFAYLNEVSSVPLQQSLRHLQTAYSNFFAKRARFPRFRDKTGRQSAEYTTSGFKWDGQNKNLTVAKLGRLRVKWSRKFSSKPSTVTLIQNPDGRYFVTLTLDETIPHLPKTGKEVGIDLGISRLATLSNGERIPNPRHTVKRAAKLASLQRKLARKTKGSNRRKRAAIRVARCHAKIANSRKDTLDKLTTRLVREFDVIAIEDLNVRGMVKNRSLAKHISCASFGMFRQMLTYKCLWYGKELRLADRFFPSSKRCHCCGFTVAKLPLDVRNWTCPECGEVLDRDENAAKNIHKFAKATTGGHSGSNGRGERVRRKPASAGRRYVLRSVNQPALCDV
jgi:putative transposase